MVGRLDNNVASTQVIRSAESATPNNNVQKVTSVQAVKVKVDGHSVEEQRIPAEKAKSIVESMNKFLSSTDSQLKFQYHEELNEYYVTIVDTVTDEVIREIPSKKLMDIHAAMREFVGLLVDRKI